MDVGKSSYYEWFNQKDDKEAKLIKKLMDILEIYRDSHGIYGAPKIREKLIGRGYKIAVRTVSKYMRILGIKSVSKAYFPKKQTKLSESEKKLLINLIKEFPLSGINQIWTTDITYIKTETEGTFYLISFIDLYSKKVVGWKLGRDMKAETIVEALRIAISHRKPDPGLIIHSDKGGQFRSFSYKKELSRYGIIPSYTSVNHSCDENAAQESWHASLKKEWLSIRKIYTYKDGVDIIGSYIKFYNTERIHQNLDYKTPDEFEITN